MVSTAYVPVNINEALASGLLSKILHGIESSLL